MTFVKRVSKICVITLIAGLICSGIPAAASDPITPAEWGAVINLSGRQRMLSQKMSKEILLISLDYQAAENLSNLEATASLFDRTLKGLRDGDPELSLPPHHLQADTASDRSKNWPGMACFLCTDPGDSFIQNDFPGTAQSIHRK